MNILTIDWDFFLSVDTDVRNSIYPNNTSGIVGSKPDNSLWSDVNVLSTTSLTVGDYSSLIEALKSVKFKFAFLSENHGEMYNIVQKFNVNSVQKITNIDFHHDLYVGCSEKPCCDNWGRLLLNENPKIEFEWVCRPDSNKYSFGNPVEAKIKSLGEVISSIKSGEFDVIHLCRSDLYSPPIFDNFFYDLWVEIVLNSNKYEVLEDLEMRNRV